MNFEGLFSITDVVQMIVAIVNLFLVWLVYKLTKKDINPKLYIKPIQRKLNSHLDTNDESYENSFDASVNKEILDLDFEQRGFPDKELFHSPVIWELELYNNSEFIATEIILNYEFTIKKIELEFGIDEADVVSEEYVPYKTIKRVYNIEYLAPHDKKVIKVLYLDGKFTKADLRVLKFKCKESNFIDSPLIIDKYEHPDFHHLSDSQQHRQLIGAHKEPK